MQPPGTLQPEQSCSSIPADDWEPILRLKGFERHTYAAGSEAVGGWLGWVTCFGALFGFILDNGAFLPCGPLDDPPSDLTTDHLFGFLAWLTTGCIVSTDDSASMLEELKRYMVANDLGGVSDDYPNTFNMPTAESATAH